MNSNLGKANEPLSEVKTGKQAFISPGDIADAFNTRFTNIGQSLAQEIPSLEIDPLAYVNPVDGVFSFNGSMHLISGMHFLRSDLYAWPRAVKP